MPLSARPASVDPLHSFIAGARVAGTEEPIPLVGTRFDVVLDGGLATVSTRRTFRNCETESVEATITFPVPVRAVLFSLEACMEGRLLKAHAQANTEARAVYEDAIERGKSSVLHEEVLRGIHMLSVGHIGPGTEVQVTAIWVLPLTNINGVGHLRIPLTVGDIYGCSGLSDSDELTHGASVQTGELNVECLNGSVTCLGGYLDAGRAEIPLNVPIDLAVTGWVSRDLHGRAEDGRAVVLRIEPLSMSDGALDIALAIDHSASMKEACSSVHPGLTKHQSVCSGLQAIAGSLRRLDVMDVWEFDGELNHIGSTKEHGDMPAGKSTEPAKKFKALIRGLSGPSGGTEIGSALNGITAQSDAQDILLITDGKSHALDVQALARMGRRFSVILIGEDSLEANVGHLAAITGGEIFVASGEDLAGAFAAILSSLRTPHQDVLEITGVPNRVEVNRGNMRLTAQWRPANESVEDTLATRAASALAASLALPFLDDESATRFAEAEGLVTHLTSLILVDEAGTAQSGIPANRKIPLPFPPTARDISYSRRMSCQAADSPSFLRSGSTTPSRSLRDRFSIFGNRFPFFRGRAGKATGDQTEPNAEQPKNVGRRNLHLQLLALAEAVDWDMAPNQLQIGDLSVLDEGVAHEIRRLAHEVEFVELAQNLGIDPVVLLIGIVAHIQSSRNRTAARIGKAILGDRSVEDLMTSLCNAMEHEPVPRMR